MKFYLILSAFFLCLLSCKKVKIELNPTNPDPQANLAKLTDSCSYTIDGTRFTCDIPFSEGKGNAGANLNVVTRMWDADTLQYSTVYGFTKTLSGNSRNDGNIVIYFVKKYGKNQLTRPLLGIKAPDTDTVLYAKGQYKYAIDFQRFNNQNGIVMKVLNRTDSSSETLLTYIDASAYSFTTLNNDSQKDSQFEVLNVYTLADGRHIVEAKFTANVFTKEEKIKRLENGYLRIHVD